MTGTFTGRAYRLYMVRFTILWEHEWMSHSTLLHSYTTTSTFPNCLPRLYSFAKEFDPLANHSHFKRRKSPESLNTVAYRFLKDRALDSGFTCIRKPL